MTARDGIEDFKELEALAEAGKFKEALDKHLWFHEASRKFPGMGGVRLSYALDIWLKLAQKYSPAMDALTNLRNSYRDLLIKGEGNFDNFHDFVAINQTLGETDDSFSVFIDIHKHFPEQAKRYYHVVEHLIVERKAYDICAIYIADPVDKYSKIQHMREMNVQLANNNPNMDNHEFKLYTDDSYVHQVCQLLEIMLALEKYGTAQRIKDTALEYFPDDRIVAVKCS